mgnify:CR=1 FL=1
MPLWGHDLSAPGRRYAKIQTIVVGLAATPQTRRARRPQPLLAYLVALAAIGQTVVLPLLDPRLVDYSPWHSHVVLGAVNAAEAAWALAHHDHFYERLGQPASGNETALPGRLRVVSSDSGRLLASAWTVDLTTKPLAPLLWPAASLWLAACLLRCGAAWPPGAPPLPPPRSL